jgi:DNA-binding transcriptional ArsR family regulator
MERWMTVSGHDMADEDLELCHELTTLEELRALTDLLRLRLYRLLREQERTVKELCDLLGESSTRLYYHVGELERVGLVRLVRTETRAGAIHKYYRSISRFVSVPFSLLHDERETPAARAAVDWYSSIMQMAALDIRSALTDQIDELDPETVFVTRNYIRTTPERAREFARRLEEFQRDLIAADDEEGAIRYAFTVAFAPDAQPSRVDPEQLHARPGRTRRDARRDAHLIPTSRRSRPRHPSASDTSSPAVRCERS